MKRNTWLYTLLVTMIAVVLAACGVNNANKNESGNNNGNESASDEPVEIHLAALESAYGKAGWEKVIEAYEAVNENVTVELTIEKNLEEVIRPQMQAGDYPDVVL